MNDKLLTASKRKKILLFVICYENSMCAEVILLFWLPILFFININCIISDVDLSIYLSIYLSI